MGSTGGSRAAEEEQCTEWQVTAVEFLRESQAASRTAAAELVGPSSSAFLASLKEWLQELDLFTLACLLDELGLLEELLDLVKQPALLLAELSDLQLQNSIPPSVTDGRWHLFVDQEAALLNATLQDLCRPFAAWQHGVPGTAALLPSLPDFAHRSTQRSAARCLEPSCSVNLRHRRLCL
ncbi:unnamed protein product [Symbiodinium microadriaticum]|nr:unnamed protein product [Symbiodinium microadriaticum]